MDIKKSSLISGEEKKEQMEMIKIKMNAFLINYFNYLVFSLAILILVVGIFFLVYPKFQQVIKENNEAKNKLDTEYETKFNYLSSIRNLKKSYQSISAEDRVKIINMVPAVSDTSLIISEIESIALKNSAVLTSIIIEPQSTSARTNIRVDAKDNKAQSVGIFNGLPDGVGLISASVSLSSVNYPVLKNIIKSFENNLRLFDIAKVNFNASDNKAVLNVYSYYSNR